MKLQDHKAYFVIFFLIYFLIIVTTSNCSTNDSSFSNSTKSIYLGAYCTYDILAPYPKLLVFEGDSVVLLDNKGQQEDITTLKDSMLSFKHHDYFLSQHTKDQLTIYDLKDKESPKTKKDNILFRKLQKSKRYKGNINKILRTNTWNYQSKYTTPNRDLIINNELQFRGDTLYHLRHYGYKNTLLYSEYEQYKFNIFELEGHTFLSLVDSKNNSENQLPIYEITDFNSSKIKWINHQSLAPEIEILTLSNKSLDEAKRNVETGIPFYLCFEAEQKLYYYNGGYYKDGAQGFLRDFKELTEKYELADTTQSGYVIYHFKVSCEKKLGRYGLIQMDLDFQETQFDPQLIKALFTIVNNTALQWELPLDGIEYCTVGQIKDIKSFVMFKIKNGVATEVLP